MRILQLLCFTAFGVLFTARCASAASVEFILTTFEGPRALKENLIVPVGADVEPNSWYLTAEVSQGDNAGLNSFGAVLTGLGQNGTMISVAPRAVDATGVFPKGFTVGVTLRR